MGGNEAVSYRCAFSYVTVYILKSNVCSPHHLFPCIFFIVPIHIWLVLPILFKHEKYVGGKEHTEVVYICVCECVYV